MKAKFISGLLAFAMILSLVAAFTVFVSADSENLQVCTDIVDVNGNKYESTTQLPADGWFELTYNDLIVDEDGSVAYFRVRGWANPLDDSDLKQFGYSLESDEIIWDDSFMAPNAGLSSYYAKAQRFDLTVNLAYVPVGEYEFHLYAKTTSGVYEIEEEYFAFEKKSMGEYSNVALGKAVTADYSMEMTFFGAAMLTDGKVPAFESQTDPLGWTAGTGTDFFKTQDQEIYVYIDLSGKYEVGCVKVFPQLFLDGQGFPSSFTILAGLDKNEMAPVASVENINESQADSTTDPTVLNFAPVVAKYIAFRVDRASWLQEADGSYLSEVGEIEVIGKAAPKATYTATFKDGDTVVATVQFEEGVKSIEEPAVPAKEGFTGAWESYTLADQDIEIKAVYSAIPADETTVADETTAAEVTTAADVTTVEEITTVASADDTTKADEKKSGCGGMISASLVIVALLGGAFILNKRKD